MNVTSACFEKFIFHFSSYHSLLQTKHRISIVILPWDIRLSDILCVVETNYKLTQILRPKIVPDPIDSRRDAHAQIPTSQTISSRRDVEIMSVELRSDVRLPKPTTLARH